MSTKAVVSEDNREVSPVLEAPLPREVLHHLYRTMLRARMLGQRLRLTSRLSEAVVSGALENAEERDTIVSAEMNPVLEILRGAEVSALMRTKGEEPAAAEQKVVAAGTASFGYVAAGLAIAEVRRQSGGVVVVFAPGKAARGAAFEEASQFAARNRLAVVFLADWTSARQSSRSHEGKDLSHWPLPTIAVDGRDAIAVYRVTKEAIGAARRGHGPTLVDCVNFLAPGGRGRDERDPVAAYRGYLKRHNAWSDQWHSELLERLKQEIGASGRNRK